MHVKGFVKTLWFKILAVILGILIIFLILAAVLGSKSSPLTATAGTVTQPLSRVTSVLGNGFSNIGHFFTRSSTYERRIDDLEGKVISAQKQLADYEETKQKLESYEDFLGIKEQHPDYQVISATVIGKDSANNFTTFVFNNVVSTILDPKISISAYEIRTRESGYITNDADIVKKGFCRLSGLDRKTKLTKGGVIATAGVGGIYPRDLIIGTVREVRNDDKDISAYAVVEPNIDVTQLTEALIMTSFEGQGVATTYDDVAEGAEADSPEVQSNPNRNTTSEDGSTESTTAGETTSSTTARRTTTTRPVTTFRTTSGRATTEASE